MNHSFFTTPRRRWLGSIWYLLEHSATILEYSILTLYSWCATADYHSPAHPIFRGPWWMGRKDNEQIKNNMDIPPQKNTKKNTPNKRNLESDSSSQSEEESGMNKGTSKRTKITEWSWPRFLVIAFVLVGEPKPFTLFQVSAVWAWAKLVPEQANMCSLWSVWPWQQGM